MPNVETQRALYRKILAYASGKPVVFRTLDVGGDKVMPFWDHGRDENPAMGWRAIRVSIDRPAVLRQQLRALIQAAAGQDLYVMFPMIAEVGEFHFGRKLLDAEIARIRAMNGELPRQIKVGAMLEVPALLFQLPGLLAKIDFLSVGTNDLFQFLFASDRGNYRISERYDVLSPVAFRVLKSILDECERAGVAVSLCGEMAGRPLDAMALLGLGFRTLSLAPPSLGAVKAMLRTVHLGLLQEFIDSLCDSEQKSVRDHLRCFAQDHHVLL
jgi:phosphotransferase system enzyme I (PtsP)